MLFRVLLVPFQKSIINGYKCHVIY